MKYPFTVCKLLHKMISSKLLHFSLHKQQPKNNHLGQLSVAACNSEIVPGIKHCLIFLTVTVV